MTDTTQDALVSFRPHANGDWYAWLDTMPPKPDNLHVVGSVLVPNPGVYAVLCKAVPQGINPAILILNLHLIQKPGIWPQVMTWAQARYDEVIASTASAPTQVQVIHDGSTVADLNVDIIS